MTLEHTREPLYGPEFAADPAAVYARLRRHGSFAPVELAPGVPATLVVGYDAALRVMRDPATFVKNPSRWQAKMPADCPVLPMMGYRPNCLFTDGEVHARYRGAVTDSLDLIDPHVLRDHVERIADDLIDGFAADGTADLLVQYARVLPFLVFYELFGCPAEIGDRIVRGMSGIFEALGPEQATAANAELTGGLMDLVALKRARPGADVTSWLLAHPARLTDEEMAHQLAVLMGSGTEPVQNIIANVLRLLLSDDRFAGDLSGGSMPVDDAIDEVLWTDPPMANYGATYPERDVVVDGALLPADQPVVISYAAANTDPAKAGGQRAGNRAHLAWSAGPHTCAGKEQARLIASVAIERLLDRLPEVELAVPVEKLEWRPGPFHRALTALPVGFPPAPVPDRAGRPPAAALGPAPRIAPPTPEPVERPVPRHRPGFLARWRRRWSTG